MSRPSTNTDQKLIKAGRELLPKMGCDGLTLRQVAKRAGVNLGMFNYHFKDKDEFLQRVLKDTYEEFFQPFAIETSGDGAPLVRLKRALVYVGCFIRENRKLLIAMIKDLLNGNKIVMNIVKTNFPRHLAIIAKLILECQRTGAIRKMQLPAMLPLLVGAIVVPNFFVEIVERMSISKLFGLPPLILKKIMLSDEAITQRVDLVLRAFAPEPKGV